MELIETLRLYESEALIQRDEALKIRKIKKKNSLFRRFILSFFVVPLVSLLILLSFNQTDSESFNNFFLIMPFIIFIWMTLRAGKRKIELKKSEQLFQESDKRMQSFEILPTKYQSYDTIFTFISYIDTKQADTLKECITLYHTNLRHQQRMRKLEDIEDQLSYIEDIDERIKRI
ncbi:MULTISPECIES: hypothetical protein [unclassified Bacillus (in: firmicutes)]|uniref:hypothetical protein n=1 Tax=unclassified Bacillus (in: firmicutes) TaxID=185979 RepID=UPI001BEA1EBA|nr:MULTISPECIES: hypothetical protein [unclassified Bacillus (in: firmicutes)]MBT2614085.1 hypothetical protein [Bacillus sp. ISL-78]MBT2629404.1 hypothetical protein [Bacillus sp. ISL-101]